MLAMPFKHWRRIQGLLAYSVTSCMYTRDSGVLMFEKPDTGIKRYQVVTWGKTDGWVERDAKLSPINAQVLMWKNDCVGCLA